MRKVRCGKSGVHQRKAYRQIGERLIAGTISFARKLELHLESRIRELSNVDFALSLCEADHKVVSTQM